jgi:hypothetical protein
LWVDDDREQWLTCPRCLNAVRNPWYGGDTGVTTEAGEHQPDNSGPQCAFCGEALKPHWRVCPHCDMPVQRRRATGDSVERDVRRDRTGSIIGLCVVGVLLVVGVIAFLATGGPQLVSASPEGTAVFGITLLILAAIVIGVGCLMWFSKDATAKAIGGALGGVAAGATIVLGFVLLVILAVCAGISDFLNTCNKGAGH